MVQIHLGPLKAWGDGNYGSRSKARDLQVSTEERRRRAQPLWLHLDPAAEHKGQQVERFPQHHTRAGDGCELFVSAQKNVAKVLELRHSGRAQFHGSLPTVSGQLVHADVLHRR
jgi:hypothetical protein